MDAVSSLMQLRAPYTSYLEVGDWKRYASALCEEGLVWWFNMEIPCLIAHLAALESIPHGQTLPSRLLFLAEAAKGFMSTDNIDALFHTFLSEKDLEAASAAAGAGVASIWDSGTDFERQETWYVRIIQLLEKAERLSPLARSSLLGFKGFVEVTYKGDLV